MTCNSTICIVRLFAPSVSNVASTLNYKTHLKVGVRLRVFLTKQLFSKCIQPLASTMHGMKGSVSRQAEPTSSWLPFLASPFSVPPSVSRLTDQTHFGIVLTERERERDGSQGREIDPCIISFFGGMYARIYPSSQTFRGGFSL